jgi:hypothetical protein
MITKKQAILNGIEQGKDEMKIEICEMLDDFIKEHSILMDVYPRQTKFIELKIDALEEFKDKIKDGKSYISKQR